MTQLLLASGSIRRRELSDQIGVHYQCASSANGRCGGKTYPRKDLDSL